MLPLNEYARERCKAGDRDPEVIARDWLDAVLAENDYERLFMPVHGLCQGYVRTFVKALEGQVGGFQPAPAAVRPAAPVKGRKGKKVKGSGSTSTETASAKDQTATAAALTARARLLLERFHIPGEGYVKWADATVPQHEARIEFDRGRIGGYASDIALHESAIKAIQGTPGAVCLGDVPETDLPAA